MDDAFVWELEDILADRKGECYRNAGIATIHSVSQEGFGAKIHAKGMALSYAVGFIVPPDKVLQPHAWTMVSDGKKSFYWDCTLQKNSRSWRSDNSGFQYLQRQTFDVDELKAWLRSKYSGREFSILGLPDGLFRFPIITKTGSIE